MCVRCSALASCPAAIGYRVVSLVWWYQFGLAPACLLDLCQPVSKARCSDLFVQYAVQRVFRTAHSLWRALRFGMVSLSSCTCFLYYVPMHLRSFENLPFVRIEVGSAYEQSP